MTPEQYEAWVAKVLGIPKPKAVRKTGRRLSHTMTKASIIAFALLTACAEAHTLEQGQPPPDLGECAHLSATLSDAGPVAHVITYPHGHPCEGGPCQQGA